MDPRKQKTKQLLQNKQYYEAKQLMLQMMQDSEQNYKFFSKLGDILMQLEQYNEAVKYYRQSLNKNHNNAQIYIKIADIFDNNLNNWSKAKEMYERCIKISPNNEQCWFNYGKHLFKQNKFDESEKCYLKCQTPRACVNYHYALLLLSKPSNTKQNQTKALELLLKATELQPNNSKYHYKYALCLKDIGSFNQSNKAFQTAIKLENYNNINILYDYAMFLWNCMNDYQNALKHLRMALRCVEKSKCTKKYAYIRTDYNKLFEQYRNNKYGKQTHNKQIIKLIIYNFDETITYWKYMNGDINKLTRMKQSDLVYDIFGGWDRINRLHLHFKRILSNNEVNIAIISFNHTNIIMTALQKVGLLKYFNHSDIIGNNTSKHLNKTNSKLNDIIDLTNKYKVNISKEVLFVDNEFNDIEAAKPHCMTYYIYSNYTLNGLSLEHMKEIEQLIGVYQTDEYDIEPPENKLSISIKHINKSVYSAIRREIDRCFTEFIPLDSLHVIEFIKTNWNDAPYQKHFLYFAKILQLIRTNRGQRYNWSNANILWTHAFAMDGEITKRYAWALCNLGHYNESESIFKQLIKSNYYGHRSEYAYFLVKRERYSEAYDHFKFNIDNHIHEMARKYQFYCSYAEVLEHMKQPCEAEKYYKLAADCYGLSRKEKRVIHSKFAWFLNKQKRYKESLHHYEIALEADECFAINHFGISKVLYKLGMFKEYEYHLQRALDSDPTFYQAKEALDKYYMSQQMTVMEEKNNIYGTTIDNDKITRCNNGNCDNTRSDKNDEEKSTMISEIIKTNTVNNIYNIEFDRFWFDNMDIITDEFNIYYDNFVNNNLNDIRYILFADTVESGIKTKIGVNCLQSLQLIMTNIYDLRKEYDIFVNVLNKYKLNKYYSIFAYNGIYTMESLLIRVRCQNDVKGLIQYYNKRNKNVTKQFKENDNDLIHLLFKFVIDY